MSDKQELIQKLLQMQKEFIKREHDQGFDAETYFSGSESDDLGQYNEIYTDLANQLVDMAHEEKGSSR